MYDILYNIMLHISYQHINRFLICKDTLKIYNSLYFWINKKHHMFDMVIPIYKTLSLHHYQAIIRTNIKRDILFIT